MISASIISSTGRLFSKCSLSSFNDDILSSEHASDDSNASKSSCIFPCEIISYNSILSIVYKSFSFRLFITSSLYWNVQPPLQMGQPCPFKCLRGVCLNSPPCSLQIIITFLSLLLKFTLV